MSDRDKLIELIKESVGGCATYWASWASHIAAHLIANDVTVQQWIPVGERLPERAGMAVLVVAENTFGQKYVVKAFTDYTGRNGFLTNEKEYDLIWDTAWKVTHWMPLPEPPKGE